MNGKAKRTLPLRNKEIRAAIEDAGLCYWWVAEELGIAHGTLSNWLRRELPPEEKQKILAAVYRLEDRLSPSSVRSASPELTVETRTSISGRNR